MDEANVKVSRTYTTLEGFFAWFCYVIAYFFCRMFPILTKPLGGFLFILILFTVTFIVLKKKAVRIKGLPLYVSISALVISLSLILSNNYFLYFFERENKNVNK